MFCKCLNARPAPSTVLGTKGAEVRETGLFKKLKKFMLNARVEKYRYRLGGPG